MATYHVHYKIKRPANNTTRLFEDPNYSQYFISRNQIWAKYGHTEPNGTLPADFLGSSEDPASPSTLLDNHVVVDDLQKINLMHTEISALNQHADIKQFNRNNGLSAQYKVLDIDANTVVTDWTDVP